MYDDPILITGVYRSGKALIAHVLDNNPQLRIVSETLHFFRFYLERYTPASERYADIVKEAQWRLGKRWGITVPTDQILQRIRSEPKVEMRDVYASIMIETFCGGAEDLRWGEMTGLQWTNIPLFLQMFPKGQTIHVIRDPRDVLASFREYTYEAPYRYLDATFTCLHSMNWAATIGASLPGNRYLILRHEDMVTKPEETITKACSFLSVPYDRSMFDSSRFKDEQGNPWTANSPFGDVGQAITPVSSGRWRSKLQPFEVMLVESILGDLLPAFGYAPSGLKSGVEDLRLLWDRVRATPLLHSRFSHWMQTGEGVERFPSDPTMAANWEEAALNQEEARC